MVGRLIRKIRGWDPPESIQHAAKLKAKEVDDAYRLKKCKEDIRELNDLCIPGSRHLAGQVDKKSKMFKKEIERAFAGLVEGHVGNPVQGPYRDWEAGTPEELFEKRLILIHEDLPRLLKKAQGIAGRYDIGSAIAPAHKNEEDIDPEKAPLRWAASELDKIARELSELSDSLDRETDIDRIEREVHAISKPQLELFRFILHVEGKLNEEIAEWLNHLFEIMPGDPHFEELKEFLPPE